MNKNSSFWTRELVKLSLNNTLGAPPYVSMDAVPPPMPSEDSMVFTEEEIYGRPQRQGRPMVFTEEEVYGRPQAGTNASAPAPSQRALDALARIRSASPAPAPQVQAPVQRVQTPSPVLAQGGAGRPAPSTAPTPRTVPVRPSRRQEQPSKG